MHTSVDQINLGDVKKMYDLPQNEACTKIKFSRSDKLVGIVKCVIQEAKSEDRRAWSIASRVLCELYGRDYGKRNGHELEKWKKEIAVKSKMCTVDPSDYSFEVAGIFDPEKKVVVHPHSSSIAAKSIIGKWKKDKKTKKSIDKYINEKLSAGNKKALVAKSVYYLSKDERVKHAVTFNSKKEILIGNKKPVNGFYIFVLDGKGKKVLAGKKDPGVFQHSSFYAANAVRCAGVMNIKDSKLVAVSLSSGHYKPTKMYLENIQKFLSQPNQLGEKETNKVQITMHM